MSDSESSERDYDDDSLPSLEEEAQTTYNFSEFQATVRPTMEICDEKHARGNNRFLEKFIESNDSDQALVEEIYQLFNCHTMPLTWTHER